jgi:hypothetical protein
VTPSRISGGVAVLLLDGRAPISRTCFVGRGAPPRGQRCARCPVLQAQPFRQRLPAPAVDRVPRRSWLPADAGAFAGAASRRDGRPDQDVVRDEVTASVPYETERPGRAPTLVSRGAGARPSR